MIDKLREAVAKYIAEIAVGLALSVLAAVAFWADYFLPPTIFETLGRYASGKVILALFLIILALVAYIVYVRPRMVFDRRVGAFYNAKSGLYFCSKCKLEKKMRVPLAGREDASCWTCPVCRQNYSNPSYKSPPAEPQRRIRSNWVNRI